MQTVHEMNSKMFQGIEQTDDSLYSSKENDESDTEPGEFFWQSNFFFILNFISWKLLKTIFQRKLKNLQAKQFNE